MKVQKLVVLGKEIELPVAMEDAEIQKNIISILGDVNPELAQELEETKYSIRIEGEIAVIYRITAIFG